MRDFGKRERMLFLRRQRRHDDHGDDWPAALAVLLILVALFIGGAL